MNQELNPELNPELKIASDFVNFTNRNIFLTGKAGTGKTTFLRNLKNTSCKRMIVVAPTGVAALNAGGVTIHSFFQLPFTPFIPSLNSKMQFNLSKEKIKIIRTLDLLVIDEISMVRSDLLDSIDEILRRYKNRSLAFGGVQLLMIGDLQQLPPVVKDEDWSILSEYYQTPFFFASLALRYSNYVTIELQHVYRQSDQKFINLLNKIRDGQLDFDSLQEINSRYRIEDNNNDINEVITLTTHNYQAQTINNRQLKKINSKSFFFKASVSGDFPEHIYPTELKLELKVGAQVMFIKNDPSPSTSSSEKRYFNGKIATVEYINFENNIIQVKSADDLAPITLERLEWNNVKYVIDDETKEIKEEIIGSFTQYPLKLAWAITIHKSQGLTFDKLIVDAAAAFAHGQVYVAFSRCRTLEGLILRSPIKSAGIILDPEVVNFNQKMQQNLPCIDDLIKAKIIYQQMLLKELFDFSSIIRPLHQSLKLYNEHKTSFVATNVNIEEKLNQTIQAIKKHLSVVSKKFEEEIERHIAAQIDIEIEKNLPLQERITKGSIYFEENLSKIIIEDFFKKLAFESDNKKVKKAFFDLLRKIEQETTIKLSCLKACSCNNGFYVSNYLKAQTNAVIDCLKSNSTSNSTSISAITSITSKATTSLTNLDIEHPKLFNKLKSWRQTRARELNTTEPMVLSQKNLLLICNHLPTTNEELKLISGLGKKKIKKYASDLLKITNEYCAGIDLDQ
ncbi:MAG: AAA family ATPase [Oligoflexia bacterium]|nr:AAA family ATPase [Oligoflexia bacterium]